LDAAEKLIIIALVCEMVVQAFGFQCNRSENVDVADCLSCKTTKFLDEKLSFGGFLVEQNFQ